jgi:mono/diheme cytochrome c family protein
MGGERVRRIRLLLCIGLVAALSGCGGGDESSQSSAGAKVFADAGCGSCHMLDAAKSHGQTGPNLDQLKPAYDAVVRQVSNGGNGMPAFTGKLSTGEIRAVALYVVDATKNSTVATEFQPDDTKVDDCKGDYACYKQALGNVAYDEGPKVALARFDALIRSNPAVGGGCHQIAHEIGHAALAHYHGNAAKALGDGSMSCWSGYYHGVIERAFGGVPRKKVAETARRLCSGSDIRKTLFVAYQCVHGLGHGLMIYSGNDLPFSLRTCNKLETRWDQSSCTGGVFMQNFLPSPMMGMKTKWLKANDLIYPCNVVAERDKTYCYLMVTSRILPQVNYDWRKAVQWCHRSEPTWLATCFQSLGRDASGQTQQSTGPLLAICKLAGAMEGECVYGAARDITANDASGRRSSRFCASAPKAFRTYCFTGIGTILGGFGTFEAQRRAACEVVPKTYLAACLRGAGVA